MSDFGSLDIVARRLASQRAIRETRISTLVSLAAVALFVVPLYVVPENTLPPAPWAEKPRDIFVLQVSIALWLFAGALATASAALAWTRWSHLAAPVIVTASVAVAGSCVAAAALTARWVALTPSTPNWPLAGALAVGCLLACVAAAGWAYGHTRLLVHD